MEAQVAALKLKRRLLVLVLACATALLAAAAPTPALGKQLHHQAHPARCPRGHTHRRQRRCRPAQRPAPRPAGSAHPTSSPAHRPAASPAPSAPAAPQPPRTTAPSGSPAAQGPCANADLPPTPSNVVQIRAATLCLINQQRSENGRSPLMDNGQLDSAAQQHSQDMVANDYFDHTTPGGETFDARIMSTGYVPGDWTYYLLGENIAVGTGQDASPAATVGAWMSDPEHRANILADFHDSGIGVAAGAPPSIGGGQPGATYTQDFGSVRTS